METYAQRAIAHIRKNGRLSVDEIGRRCGVSRQAVYKWIWGGDCNGKHQKALEKLVSLATKKMNLRRAEKAVLHMREAATHMALAISAMNGNGNSDDWISYWDDYQKAVKTMLRLKAMAERFDSIHERHAQAERRAELAALSAGGSDGNA